MKAHSTHPLIRFFTDRRGAAQTEYVVLLGTVTIAAAVAIAGWGPPLVSSFERTRSILISPAP
jgi:Flp pilus assembly pilin Flp